MDEIDIKAIQLINKAILSDEREIEATIKTLKNLAKIKKRKTKKAIRDILDYWASEAYKLDMEKV
ncbi:hypothetical protein J422_06095 [Methanocaldococcus villosus KIN24-T80]|uniref:Uncharacterized protein n=1 Tax=Methanocaldococcus villosus KIN24-T80 TaxID=1069083 RepID=N6UTS7_9EURY|nr:hypothetical protein [Methanocaldococcus villosus]ENN95749.1 hypothetical protein J422_06095 [Methanocaldococcus villosus KIN24-T80]